MQGLNCQLSSDGWWRCTGDRRTTKQPLEHFPTQTSKGVLNNERGKAVWYKDVRGVWRKKVISKPFFFLCWIAHLSKIIVSGIPVCKPVENDAAHSAFLLSPGSPGSTLKALSKWELQLGRSFRKLFEKLLLGSRTTGKRELLSCTLMDGCSFLSSEQKWRTLGVGGEGRRENIQGNKIKVIQRIDP